MAGEGLAAPNCLEAGGRVAAADVGAALQYLFPINKLLLWAVGGLLAMPLGSLVPCLPTTLLAVEPHRAMVLVQCPPALFDGYHFIFIF